MPLYSDSNYYYSGGSSQLYSPYYPGSSYTTPTTSSSPYTSYSSTYNRTFGGSYVVPLTPPRSPAYTTHSFSSRYQPKLSTITESSPLTSRHSLMPLTRILSPKISSYSTASSLTSKYIPPRPIPINTADIDVSPTRYRKRTERSQTPKEDEVKKKKEEKTPSPSSSIKRSAVSTESKEEKEESPRNARSTIKRDRAVVRLSIIRSRSKDRKSQESPKEASAEVNRKRFRDLPHDSEEKVSWRQRLADDLAAFPTVTVKKSPGDLIRERYLIQEIKINDNDKQKTTEDQVEPTEKAMEEVLVELDPVDHSIRRLSIPNCPSFHDICEDISSDKIDDDLNAGALRRRASLIQEQEQELLNQLQNSASGTFQFIHLERQESDGNISEHKRKSRKSRKTRHKITAIVEVDNALPTIIQEKEEELKTPKNVAPKPKFSFNVESVEEHHEVHKIFKLPKKKSVKGAHKPKDEPLPEGFFSAKPKEKAAPKPKEDKKQESFVSTAEIFTFDTASIEKCKQEELEKEKVIETPQSIQSPVDEVDFTQKLSQIQTPKVEEEPIKVNQSKKTSMPILKSSMSFDANYAKTSANNVLEKTQSLNVEENDTDEKIHENKLTKAAAIERIPEEVEKDANIFAKVEEAPKKISKPIEEEKIVVEKKAEVKNITKDPIQPLKTSTSLESVPVTAPKPLTKSKSEDNKPLVATPKPIRKAIQKSESGEDFWSQIGTRETLYMTNRKKQLWAKTDEIEEEAQKIDNEIKEEAKVTEEVKPLTIETKLPQKAIPKEEVKSPKSPLSKIKPKENNDKSKIVIPEKKPHSVAEQAATTPTTPSTPTTKTLPKINSGQLANKSPEPQEHTLDTKTKISTATSENKADNALLTNNATAKIATNATRVSEASAAADAAKVSTETTTITKPLVIALGKTEIAQEPEDKVNKLTEANKKKLNVDPTKSSPSSPIETVDKQLQQQPSKTTKSTIDKITKVSPICAKTKQSPIKTVSPINADQFIAVAPAKSTTTSPTKTDAIKAKNASSPIKQQANKLISDKLPTTTKSAATATATTTSSVATTIASNTDRNAATSITTIATTVKNLATNTIAATSTVAAAAATTTTTTETKGATKPIPTTSTATPAPASSSSTVATTIALGKSSESLDHSNATTQLACGSDSGSGKNLSKFATVSNLAQCLQDVDADLEDYIPSSAENSDFTDDDSSFDYSSADGRENLSASMKKKLRQRRRKEKLAEKPKFDPKKKITIDTTNKCYVKDEAPRYPLVATPRPLWKREKIVYPSEDSDEDSDSDESGSTEETTEDSEECTTSEEYEDDLRASGATSTDDGAASGSNTSKNSATIIRMSTCSNDSGFEGGTAPSSPKKMLECDVNCHKKCERLTANLCGVNQKLIVEALAIVKRGAREARDSPSTPPSSNPAFKIEANDEQDETSYTYSQFQKSGRFTTPATVIPRFKNYSVDDFHFLTVLGKGSFGKVLLAELRDTTYYYAVKCLKKDVVLEDDDVDSTLIERKVLALGTKHPYLCHLFCTFQTESHLFFVMEYLNGGDLMFHIQESGRFTEERARFYGAEIISGLKFLHKKGIIYRDLKLDNVLLDYEGHVRIADFGMCKLQIYLDKTADSFCGTPDYMAPEIIKGEKYNQNVDWWSFGVLLYEMLIGQSPFSGCDEDELFWSICNEIPWFPVYISAEATSILKGLLEKDYTKRVGSQYSLGGEISEHIFFRPIDWNLLEKRQLQPPFKPQVKHPLDTQYFDRVFTKERVRLTPIDKEILQSMDQKQFAGFTYTNPHITLD